jgi:hypothetical protein
MTSNGRGHGKAYVRVPMLSLNRAGGVNATRDDVILFAFSGHSQLRRLPVFAGAPLSTSLSRANYWCPPPRSEFKAFLN